MGENASMKPSPWRLNSPLAQASVVALIMFCCSGMNSTVLALGAGGSRVELLPFLNTITAVGLAVAAAGAVFGGTLTNKLGPRLTLLIATSGYPSFVVSLWVIDSNLPGAKAYAWVATIWHGISVAAFYPAAGYIVSAYSPEHLRGRYVASMWASQLAGTLGGSCIVLGITAGTSSHRAGVPTAVYATIVSIQSLGFLLSFLVQPPKSIRRDDGQPIAHFKLLTWREEIVAMRKSFLRTETLLLAIALFASQMPFSMIAALNSYFFSARTRALAALCYSASSLIGTCLTSFVDWPALGLRRRRSLLFGVTTLVSILATWSSLFWFLSTHASNRHAPSPKIDWSDHPALSHSTTSPSSSGTPIEKSNTFASLLAIVLALGLTSAMYLTYHIWLISSFTNAPSRLSRQSGYLNALRLTGLAVAFGFDSRRVDFMKEAIVYFVLLVVGMSLALGSSWGWLRNSRYGDVDEREEGVIVPTGTVVEREGKSGDDEESREREGEGMRGKNEVAVMQRAVEVYKP